MFIGYRRVVKVGVFCGLFRAQGLDLKGLVSILCGIPGFDTAIDLLGWCERRRKGLKRCLTLPQLCSVSLVRRRLYRVRVLDNWRCIPLKDKTCRPIPLVLFHYRCSQRSPLLLLQIHHVCKIDSDNREFHLRKNCQ